MIAAALEQLEPCPRCDGSGWDAGDDCASCVGSGVRRLEPDEQPVLLDDLAPHTRERAEERIRGVLRGARLPAATDLARAIVGALNDTRTAEAWGRARILEGLRTFVPDDLCERVFTAHTEALLEHARVIEYWRRPTDPTDPTGERSHRQALAIERHVARIGARR